MLVSRTDYQAEVISELEWILWRVCSTYNVEFVTVWS